MPSTVLLDACGRRRSPATLSSFHQRRPPRNKGQRYPADPPTVEEIISVMHAAGEDNEAVRLRGLIVVLWRAGLRISEALALTGATWTWVAARSWSATARAASVARLGWTAGHGNSWAHGCSYGPRFRWARCSACCAARPPVTPGLRLARARNCTTRPPRRVSGVASRRISCATLTRWRCHGKGCRCSSSNANSATPTSVYLRGIDNTEIVHAVHERPAPMIPATNAL
jgi:hypothetical protein